MDRRIIWAVAYREETGMAGPNIPTIGYPASASDLYRVVGIAQTGHEGWNSCYTDIETCAALARVVEGPVSGWADIEAAETALQALLWHDRIDVLAPGFKMQHDKFVGYQRCDEIRSDLAFQLFKCCNPYDSILAI